MKRRNLSRFWNALQAVYSLMVVLHTPPVYTAIVPPPWSNPARNPCASMPGGWQLLYWPPLDECFKIFTIGHPCPDTMELSPAATMSIRFSGNRKKAERNAPVAECRCPPDTALSAQTEKCHKIFERGPCGIGEYFSPMIDGRSNHQEGARRHRLGECKKPHECPNGKLYWPKDNKCYTKFTKGPCRKGKLLVLNDEALAECKCENSGDLMKYFYAPDKTCHEHFTKGPCSTPGELFLPEGRCGCCEDLPQFHADFKMCFELNTVGPCPSGHIYSLPDSATHAQCQCKDGYVPWTNGRCYRLYTRGPCAANEFLINATSCVTNFCGKSRLYFPDQKSCYRIGSQGPCDLNHVVVFDFTARPSVDGISYNGLCGCSGIISNLDQQCNINDFGTACESTPGMVELNGNCYKLYSRGPCGPGQWLAPLKSHTNSSENDSLKHLYSSKAKCVCRPGFTKAEDDKSERCNAPSVGLARYLNVNNQRQRINSKYYDTSSHSASASTIKFEFLN